MSVIAVGVDGSDAARRALEWAVDEARMRGAKLVVVHAWHEPMSALAPPYAAMAVIDPSVFAEAAQETVRESLAGIDVGSLPEEPETRVVAGMPARALLDVGADLIVIGSRGLGGIMGTLLGSVTHQVVHHATVPVVVIPPAPSDDV